MCGRYSLTIKKKALIERFEVEAAEAEHEPRFNVAPGQLAPVVVRAGSVRLAEMCWGLVPAWAKDPAIGNRLINARVESAHRKAAFRNLVDRHRCLVPADGFYEWKKQGAGGKTPYHARLASGEPFALAGLWDRRREPDGSERLSYTILTTEPNRLLAPIHSRMPVILRRGDEARWLDPSAAFAELREPVAAPYPADAMTCHPVSTAVNSPAHDAPDCIAPLPAPPYTPELL